MNVHRHDVPGFGVYLTMEIPKRNGKMRRIVTVPGGNNSHWARCLNSVADTMGRWYQSALPAKQLNDVVHGFVPGRSAVTNALAHVGRRFSLCFDLKDFFDTVTCENEAVRQIEENIRPMWVCDNSNGALYDDWFWLMPTGCASQGLPTSPHIANFAAMPMDQDIQRERKRNRFGWSFTYTRYADDLTFSYDIPSVGQLIREFVPRIVAAHGFVLNEEKTHFYDGRHGMRIITGVAVSHNGVHMTRQTKRRLRSATHHLDTGKIGKRTMRKARARAHENKHRKNPRYVALCMAEGIAEWAKLKLPKEWEMKQDIRVEQSAAARLVTTVAASVAEKARAIKTAFARKLER